MNNKSIYSYKTSAEVQAVLDRMCYSECATCASLEGGTRATLELRRDVLREDEARLSELRRGALQFTNQLRGFLGLPALADLQAGDVGNAYSCTISASIADNLTGLFANTDYSVVVVRTKAGNERLRVPMPDDVVRFLRAFDDGKYPDLVAGRPTGMVSI